jgi:pantothenate kinase
VSILRVDSYGQYERVSGTSVGGGTFWGLCRLLTKVKTFAEVEQLSSVGNNGNVDLLVSDIYGPNGFEQLGLPGDVIASSVGKIGSVRHVENPAEVSARRVCVSVAPAHTCQPSEYEAADIIRSLLFMITNNVTQIAFLNAKAHGVNKVIFAGGFLQHNPYVSSMFAIPVLLSLTTCRGRYGANFPMVSTSGPKARCRPFSCSTTATSVLSALSLAKTQSEKEKKTSAV